ncbi:MAG: PIN domain-containing protein [Acidobacteria bacterium]|nr:PIN domain-containing protein [Acidobacteriota bacterium]
MVYVDTSVALAHLFAEDRVPPDELWKESLVSSRLFEYEIWTRVHARQLAATHSEAARLMIARVALLELAPPVLARAIEPFPAPVRTLDAMHLASIEFLRARGQQVRLAAYDSRLTAVAERLGIPLYL